MQISLVPDLYLTVFKLARNAWRYLVLFSSAILSWRIGFRVFRVGVAASMTKGGIKGGLILESSGYEEEEWEREK